MTNTPGQAVTDPARLNALRKLALLDTPSEAIFDRLTALTSKIVNAPVSLVSLIDVDRQFFKSSIGLPDPWGSQRETPLSHSFCQHVVTSGEPLVITDAREVPLVRDNMAIPDLNVIGYLGMPLTTSDGFQLGSFCVIDGKPRVWTDEEIETVRDLSLLAMAMIETRSQLIEFHQMADSRLNDGLDQLDASKAENRKLTATLDSVRAAVGKGADSAQLLKLLAV